MVAVIIGPVLLLTALFLPAAGELGQRHATGARKARRQSSNCFWHVSCALVR